MAGNGYQASDNETANLGDGQSATAELAQHRHADSPADRLAAARHAAMERCRQLEKSASECVQKHPGGSVAAAAVAGVALGLLLAKSWSRHQHHH